MEIAIKWVLHKVNFSSNSLRALFMNYGTTLKSKLKRRFPRKYQVFLKKGLLILQQEKLLISPIQLLEPLPMENITNR
jgi:hypothetical protein